MTRKSRELVCCKSCGRDTRRPSKLCSHCDGSYQITSDEEEKEKEDILNKHDRLYNGETDRDDL